MNYEEFRMELFTAVKGLEGTAGKEVKLVNKGGFCPIEGLEQIIAYLNLSCCGRDGKAAEADFLLVVWRADGSAGWEWRSWIVKECYDRFAFGGWQEILPEVEERIREAGNRGGGFLRGGYEACRPDLILRPIPVSRGKERMEDGIFWERGTFALVLYGIVWRTEEELITLKITRELTDRWDVSDNALLADALYRTGMALPPRLYRVSDTAGKEDLWEELAGSGGSRVRASGPAGGRKPAAAGGPVEFPKRKRICGVAEETLFFGEYGLRLTNVMGMGGAAVFFYPGVRERLAELLGGDFYVVFPNVHEACVYPVREEAVRRLRLTAERRTASCGAGERLPIHIYRYCRERGELAEV